MNLSMRKAALALLILASSISPVISPVMGQGVEVGVIVAAPTVTNTSATQLAANAPNFTITGTGFDTTVANNSVVLNGAGLTNFTGTITASTGGTTLTVTMPAAVNATGVITAVVTSDGGSSGAAVGVVSILPAVAAIYPASGSVLGTSTTVPAFLGITGITGTALGSATGVTIGGANVTNAQVAVWGATIGGATGYGPYTALNQGGLTTTNPVTGDSAVVNLLTAVGVPAASQAAFLYPRQAAQDYTISGLQANTTYTVVFIVSESYHPTNSTGRDVQIRCAAGNTAASAGNGTDGYGNSISSNFNPITQAVAHGVASAGNIGGAALFVYSQNTGANTSITVGWASGTGAGDNGTPNFGPVLLLAPLGTPIVNVANPPLIVTPGPITTGAGPENVVVTTSAGSAQLTGAYLATPAISTPYSSTITAAMSGTNQGTTAGGDSVTITGNGFTTATGVTFGGVAATGLAIVSDTTLTVTTPANGTGGLVSVVVTCAGSTTATAPSAFNYVGPPTITGVSPTSGPVTGGTNVLVTGGNLFSLASGTPVVAINCGNNGSIGAPWIADTGSYAPTGTFTRPAGYQGTGATDVAQISAFTSNTALFTNQCLGSGTSTFTYTIPSLTVGANYSVVLFFMENWFGKTGAGGGVNAQGTGAGLRVFNVAINGTQVLTNFDIWATAYAQTSIASYTGSTDGQSVGIFEQFQTTANGSGQIVLTFTTVTSGASVYGIEVFNSSSTASTVTFNGNAVSYGGTTNAITVPSTAVTTGAGPATISVTTAQGTATNSSYVCNPVVSTVAASSGSTAGGSTVTIAGNGFTTATGVTFGGNAVPGFSNPGTSDTSLTVTTPAGTAGAVNVVVTGPSGSTGTLASGFTYIAPPTITGTIPASGPVTGGTPNVMINGTSLTGVNQVTFAGQTGTIVANPAPFAMRAGLTTASVGTSPVFLADNTAYLTGGGNTANTGTAITMTAVNAAFPSLNLQQGLFQYNRWATMSYTIPGFVANANYTVVLFFAEVNFNAAAKREFNIVINGTTVKTNYDIFAAAGGEFIATYLQYSATANASGQIVIAFNNGAVDNAQANGIYIAPAFVTATPPAITTGGGVYPVVATNTTAGVSGTGSYTYQPVVTGPGATCGLSPADGGTVPTTPITITGNGFTGATSVTFGTNPPVTLTAANVPTDPALVDTQLINVMPPATGTAGTVAVSVTAQGTGATGPGTSSTTLTSLNTYTYLQSATVTNTAATGQTLPSNATSLIITGTGFSTTMANDTVTLSSTTMGTNVSATVTAATATHLTVTMPTPSPAPGEVISAIVSNGVASSGTAVGVATATAPPTILSSTTNRAKNATTVTITGTGFDSAILANNVVTFSGPAALGTPAIAGSVTAVVATGATTISTGVPIMTLTYTFTSDPPGMGELDAIVTVDGGASTPGTP